MTVRIVTDSTCDLPSAVIERYNIYVMPLYIHVGSHSYLDGLDMSREEFYAKLPTFATQPTTAVPSMQKFYALYNTLAEEGAREVLSIHVSSALSAIVSVARAAARETHATTVTVFDSRQLSMGTGFMVEAAAQMAQEGRSAAAILAVLNDQIKRTHVCAMLDTLEYLRRSGRMNSIMATLGKALQIKPLLKMYDGTPSTERVRTRKHAMKRMLDLLRQHGPFERIAFLHSGAIEQVHALIHEARDMLPPGVNSKPEDFGSGDQSTVRIGQINPVLGVHVGPGVVGFAGVSAAPR